MSSPQETESLNNLGKDKDNLPPVEFSPTSEASVSASASVSGSASGSGSAFGSGSGSGSASGSASASGSGSGSGPASGSGSSLGSRFARHITKEQIHYFQRIVAACLSHSPVRRHVGQRILAEDPHVQGVLCLLAPFIYKSMCINIADEHLKYLVFMMRMIRALLENPTLNLDKYIHLMVPGPLGCLLADQITPNPGAEDHWAVRMYANGIISIIVDRYNCTQSTIIECYEQALEAEPLETVYGAVIGLGRMGEPVVRQWLLPKLKAIAGRIEPYLKEEMEMSSVSLKTLAAQYISEELAGICGPILAELVEGQEEQDDLTGAFYLLGLAEESD